MKKVKISKQHKGWYCTEQCILASNNISKQCFNDLCSFHILSTTLSETASKKTHYEGLEEYHDIVNDFIHNMLTKYGFISGDVEKNKNNIDANFWWKIYGLESSIINSPNLKSQTQIHHSSAWERNEALKIELNIIIQNTPILKGE